MNIIRRALIACVLALLVPIAALAQSTAAPDPTGADQPSIVPGTTLAWPEHDNACDTAWNAQEYDDALPLCLKAATEYDAVIPQIDKPIIKLTMVYNRAYTLYEIATCYAKTGRVNEGHVFGMRAVAVYHDIVDPLNAKKFADVTMDEIKTRVEFDMLLQRLHVIFTDIGKADDVNT